MTAQETEHDEITLSQNQAYVTVDIHNQTGGGDQQPNEPESMPHQVGEQQQTDEPAYEQIAP